MHAPKHIQTTGSPWGQGRRAMGGSHGPRTRVREGAHAVKVSMRRYGRGGWALYTGEGAHGPGAFGRGRGCGGVVVVVVVTQRPHGLARITAPRRSGDTKEQDATKLYETATKWLSCNLEYFISSETSRNRSPPSITHPYSIPTVSLHIPTPTPNQTSQQYLLAQ